jgi:hypothetical protein
MISQERIAELAELYDRYNNSLDPFSDDCAAAKSRFLKLLDQLYAAQAADVDFNAFRFEAVKLCREYLRKN